ncbi:hypothetical protein AAG906_000535 [Vitis piasezkii]
MMALETRSGLLSKMLTLGPDRTSGQRSVDSMLTHCFFFGVCVTRGAEGGEAFMVSRRPWDGYQAVCRFDSNVVGRLVVWSSEESHPINRESNSYGCIFLHFSFILFVNDVPLAIPRPVYLGDCGSAFVPVASLCQVCFLFLSFHLQLLVSSIFLGLLGFVSAPCSTMPAKKDVASFNAVGPRGKALRSRNGISVQLVDGDPMNTKKAVHNGLRFPFLSLFKEFLHYTQIRPTYIHPNIARC